MDISRKSLSIGIFTCLLQYFPKNRAILVQKLGKEKKLTKSVSGYLKTKKKKVPVAIQPEGGGGVRTNGLAIKRRTFFAASLTTYTKHDLTSEIVTSYLGAKL